LRLFSTSTAWSAACRPPACRPGDARSGSLLLKTEDGYADATRLGIDVDLAVSGPTIRANVTQLFRNPTKDWVEAVYVYPLPPGGAVDTLKMVVGDRVVVGEIKERQQARVIYEQAKRERPEGGADRTGAAEHLHQLGRQYRPGETVLVQIEYQEPVHQTGNDFSLRVPMVVGAALQSRADRAERRLQPDRRGWGATAPIRCRTATASRRRCSTRATRAGQSDRDHGAPAGRLSRSAR
jgi:Ca-activated chloride channel family protein